jgi:hypothetical protein
MADKMAVHLVAMLVVDLVEMTVEKMAEWRVGL